MTQGVQEKFNRLNDRFFKYLFANTAHKFLLIELLNDIFLDIPEAAERLPPVVDLVYSDRETSPLHTGDKMPRFDVVTMLEDNRLVHIEVQLEHDGNLISRILSYGAREYFSCTRKGENYSDVQVICITILDFLLFKVVEDYHTLHRILNVKDGTWSLRGLEFHFIELPKLRRLRTKPATGLERLLHYLGGIGGEEDMQALAEADTRVAKMLELEGLFRSDPDLLQDYLTQEQAQRDYRAELKRSETRGKFKVLADFIRKGLVSLSDAAAAEGMSEDELSAQIQTL